MAATKFLAIVLLIMFISGQITSAQLNIVATTFPDTGGNSPNTYATLSENIGSSLLGSGVPALLWVIVKSSDVTTICKQIVSTDSLSFAVTVTDATSGDQETLTVKATATGGCEAAADESGTEMVLVDNQGRSAALICPQNAGSIGCGVYMTGSEITAFYNDHVNGGLRRRMLSTGAERNLLDHIECSLVGMLGGFILVGMVVQPISLFLCGLLPIGANFLCYLLALDGGLIIGAYMVGCKRVEDNNSSCFPGDATLQLPGGISKSMAELDLGDKVAVWKPDGTLGYEDIYCFGHRDAITTSRFYKISMKSSEGLEASIELSGRHFAPILSPGIGSQKVVYLRAQEIRIGDMMWGLKDNAKIVYTVTGIIIKVKLGLYNPFTMAGTIVVNGVVASVHSDWFLDTVFDKLGVTHLLPTTYQVALAPPRMLYRVMGKDSYTVAYDWLDKHMNLVQHIHDYSGTGASMILIGVAVGAPSWYYFKKSTGQTRPWLRH